MPDLSKWDPTAAATLFVEEKTRRQRDSTPAIETIRRQNHFKGVFQEAKQYEGEREDDDGNDNDGDVGSYARANIFDF